MDADKVLKNRPWLFKSDLVAMERCRLQTLPESYKFKPCEFWVQIHKVPWDMLKEDVISSCEGSQKITPITSRDMEKWTNYACIRVNINIKEPLKTRLALPRSENENHQAQVLYKKLSRLLCFVVQLGTKTWDASEYQISNLLLRISKGGRKVVAD